MDVPATGGPPGPRLRPVAPHAAHDRMARALRARWRAASLSSGWRFPGDWGLPEVDAVCAAVVRHGEARAAEPALAGLARARAAAGTGLEETLTDLAALHAVLAEPDGTDGFVAPDVDAIPVRLLRVVAVAWAEVALAELSRPQVTDPLTGLPTVAYLRTRLAELYRRAARDRTCVAEGHALVVVSMSFERAAGWARLGGMILAADALKAAFDGGESFAVLGPSTVAAVVSRDAGVASGAVRLRRELTERVAVDVHLAEVGAPRVNVVRLPPEYADACELLDTLGRR
ncbi:GGDEF domain-containing protein [Prauserella oleivorans]|uniref:GGDEF domain-containing protein n=1 Tax=Prauserella oleivorans TaxID=1478153 RepID=A0ABW5WF12_9PSEU